MNDFPPEIELTVKRLSSLQIVVDFRNVVPLSVLHYPQLTLEELDSKVNTSKLPPFPSLGCWPPLPSKHFKNNREI